MDHNPHHLVLGELTDFLSGRILPDTHDERYKQKLARLLVVEKGFAKNNILKDYELLIAAGNQKAKIKIDFLIKHKDRTCMMLKYAPGSLVTRRLSNLALSRVIEPYQIPAIVTTNGEDAEVISGQDGSLTGYGLKAIPGINDPFFQSIKFPNISKDLFEKASRIAYACEINGACPCDTDICVIK